MGRDTNSTEAITPKTIYDEKKKTLTSTLYQGIAERNAGSNNSLEKELLTFIESFTDSDLQLRARKDMVRKIMEGHRENIHDDRAIEINNLRDALESKMELDRGPRVHVNGSLYSIKADAYTDVDIR